jgi:hypothetical protein
VTIAIRSALDDRRNRFRAPLKKPGADCIGYRMEQRDRSLRRSVRRSRAILLPCFCRTVFFPRAPRVGRGMRSETECGLRNISAKFWLTAPPEITFSPVYTCWNEQLSAVPTVWPPPRRRFQVALSRGVIFSLPLPPIASLGSSEHGSACGVCAHPEDLPAEHCRRQPDSVPGHSP